MSDIKLPKTLLLLISIIVVFLLASNIKLLKINQTLKKQRILLENVQQNNYDRQLSLWELLSEGEEIDTLLASNINDDTISLVKDNRSLVEDYRKPILIFRVTDNNCVVCVDSVLHQLMSFSDDVLTKVVILTSNKTMRELRLFTKSIPKSIKTLRLLDNSMSKVRIERINIPYFFVLQSNHIMSNIYIPDKQYPKGTNDYVNLLFSKNIFPDR